MTWIESLGKNTSQSPRFKPISTTCAHRSDTQGLQTSHGFSIEKFPCGHFLSHHQLFQMNNYLHVPVSNYNHLIDLRTEQKASTLKKFENNLLRLRPRLCGSSKTKALNADPPKIYRVGMFFTYSLQWVRTLAATVDVPKAPMRPQRMTRQREGKNTFSISKNLLWKQGFPSEMCQKT